jgi:HSP20 family protein
MALPIRRTSDGSPEPRPARWDPFRELEELRERMDRLMDGIWRGDPDQAGGSPWSPAAAIEETDQAWIVKVELPGVRRDDVTVELRDRELWISGVLDEQTQRDGTPRQVTRRMGRFEYRTTLPGEVQEDGVEASLDNGVLSVRIPKPEPVPPQRIAVNGGRAALDQAA